MGIDGFVLDELKVGYFYFSGDFVGACGFFDFRDCFFFFRDRRGYFYFGSDSYNSSFFFRVF